MSGLGDELRAAREARRLSLTDVSEQIHIRSVYLQALEEENWTAISAPVYVRGFLRTYARFLGLDAEAAVDRFTALTGAPRGAGPATTISPTPTPTASVAPSVVQAAPKMRRDAPSRREPAERKRPSIFVMLAAAVAGVLVAFVGYKFYQYQVGNSGASDSGTVAVASPQATSASSPSHAPSAAPTQAPLRTLALRVTGYSWIHVDIDGKPALEGNFQKGYAKEFHGDSASVSVGNAGGVDVEVNGREQGPMGADGAVVQKQFALGSEDKRGHG